MIFEQIYYILATLKPNFLSIVMQVNNYNQGIEEEDENPFVQGFYVFMGIVMILALLVMIVSIFKDFILHFIFKVPEFSLLYRFNPKNTRLAFKIIGCHMIVADGGDRRGQYMFLISYLKRRFPDAKPMDLSEIPNLHQYYPEIQEILKWLNKHLDEEHKLQFIDYMVDLAFFNEKLSRREMRLIYYAGKVLGIPQNEIKSILSMRYKFYQDKRRREQEHRRKTRSTRRPSVNLKKQALKILGLSPAVKDFNEVKKAYRNMAKKHHPDRFHNDSEQEKEKAHERFTAINTAYEYLEQVLK